MLMKHDHCLQSVIFSVLSCNKLISFTDKKMVIRYNDILTVITTLCDDEGLKVTVKGSAKGGLIAGATSAVGGLVLGPLGLAIGGTVGGLIAYATAEPYKPVSQVRLQIDCN